MWQIGHTVFQNIFYLILLREISPVRYSWDHGILHQVQQLEWWLFPPASLHKFSGHHSKSHISNLQDASRDLILKYQGGTFSHPQFAIENN